MKALRHTTAPLPAKLYKNSDRVGGSILVFRNSPESGSVVTVIFPTRHTVSEHHLYKNPVGKHDGFFSSTHSSKESKKSCAGGVAH